MSSVREVCNQLFKKSNSKNNSKQNTMIYVTNDLNALNIAKAKSEYVRDSLIEKNNINKELSPATFTLIPPNNKLIVCKALNADRNIAYTGYILSKIINVKYKDTNMFLTVNFEENSDPLSIKINRSMRDYIGVSEGDHVIISESVIEPPNARIIMISVAWDRTPVNKKLRITNDYLLNRLHSIFNETVINDRQSYLLIDNIWGKAAVLKIIIEDIETNNGKSQLYATITSETKIDFFGECMRSSQLLNIENLSFETFGVGGQDSQLEEVIRRAFLTRSIPEHIYKKLGIDHIKGMILYGPPGCGKTLIARNISKALNCKEPTIINGPEILGKYVGESEAKIRVPFDVARNNPDELHVIIFDEIDSICRQRGSDSGRGGINDSIVNQLLTNIDGVNALNNILVIGMTNRMELLDEALIRAGRLEVHIEIGLPDENGRSQILQIHTKAMKNNGVLSDDVDLNYIASQTKNMTGAELASVIKEASSFALRKVVNLDKINESAQAIENIMITSDDFQQALTIIKPAFGSHEDTLTDIISVSPFRNLSESYENTVTDLYSKIKYANTPGINRIIIHGDAKVGKTYLAAHVAVQLQIPFTMYLGAIDLISLSEKSKADRLIKLFQDASKVDDALLIIDDCNILVEWTPPNSFSNRMIQTIKTLLGTIVTQGRLTVILCTSDFEDLSNRKLFDRIDHIIAL